MKRKTIPLDPHRAHIQDNMEPSTSEIPTLGNSEMKFLYDKVFHNSPIGMNLFRISTNASVLVNQTFLDITGYQKKEVLGHSEAGLNLFMDTDIRNRWMEQLRQGKDVLNQQAQIRDKKGDIHDVVASLITASVDNEPAILVMAYDTTELKSVTINLEQTKSLLDETQHLTKVGGWEYSIPQKKFFWTDEVYEILGVSRDFDLTFYEKAILFRTNDDRKKLALAFSEAIEHGVPYDVELQLVGKNEQPIWVRTIVHIDTEDGYPIRLVGNVMDITESKESQLELMTNQRRLKLLLEHAPAAIAMFDREMRCIAVSQRFLHDYGVKFEDEMGKTHYEAFPEIPNRWREIHQRCLAGATEKSDCDSFIRQDGHTDWVRWEMRPWYETDNQIGGVILFSEVITEEIEAANALRESEAKFRDIFQNHSAVILLIDPADGAIVDANQAAAKFYGWTVEELCRKKIGEINTLSSPQMQKEIFTAVKDGQYHREFTHRIADGSLRDIETYGSLVKINGRNYLHSIIHDITDRKKAEEDLVKSEKKFALLFHKASMPIGLIHLSDWVVVDVNQAWLQLLEYSREEVVGKTIDQLNLSHDSNPQTELLNMLNRDPSIQDLEVTIFSKTGREITVITYINQLEIEGEPYLLSSIQDISQRKKAEEKLRINEHKLLEAQELAHLGYWEWDIRTGEVEWSDQVYRVFGLDPHEFKPNITSILSFSPWPEDHNRDMELINRAKASHEPGSYEQKFLRPDHSIGYYFSTFQGIYNAKGDLTSMVGTVFDITGRKLVEQELRRQALRLQTLHIIDQLVLKEELLPEEIAQKALNAMFELLDCSQASFWIYNPIKNQAELLATNQNHPMDAKVSGPQVLSFHRDPSVWLNLQMIIVDDITHPPVPSKFLSIPDDQAVSYIILPLRSSNTYIGEMDVSWTHPHKITPEDQEIMSEIASQITISIEQARLREETRKYAENLEKRVLERTNQLEESNRELEAFAYSVSHDLRAPLRAIDGFTRLLEEEYEGEVDDEGKRLIHVIRASTEKMDHLITDILELSRVNRAQMKFVRMDMTSLVRSVYNEIANEEIQSKYHFEVADLPEACADPILMHQVWLNLISNSIKYAQTRSEPEIQIRGTMENGLCNYTIQDNGVGFNPKYKDKLFNLFQRLHRDGEFEGTGVGLAIVQRAIQRHNGRVWAESTLNTGAEFGFSIPYREVEND